MGREKRGGYLIDWWIGDHLPKHAHIYKDGRLIAKVEIPGFAVLNGKINRKIRKILAELIEEGKI
jgi:hypothetical protein